jgi:hypothetical protein
MCDDACEWEAAPVSNYWQNICDIQQKQEAKGMAKYNMSLEQNPADIITRLTYMQEEIIDMLMYAEWCKDYLRNMEGKNER